MLLEKILIREEVFQKALHLFKTLYYLCFIRTKYKLKTMATYRFKIVGVHYAVNTDYALHREETDDMHTRTANRLMELDKLRPKVVLIPEPSNPADARAVMARTQGQRIGYVAKTQLDTLHALIQANGGKSLRADICEVEARKHGWLSVELQAEGDVLVESSQKPLTDWNGWTCTLPSLAPDDAQFAREEAEVMLDEILSNSADGVDSENLERIETYLRLWLTNALHDLSHEAHLTREHYIMWLKDAEKLGSQNAMSAARIKALVAALEKQRTAICGNKRMHLRTDVWWKGLMKSAEMNLLWKTWMARVESNLEQGLEEINNPLKALPNDMFALIDEKGLFFSRLHYNHVPRVAFWQIVSLMLLRERTLQEMEGGCSISEPQENLVPAIPKEFETSVAKKILARLQKKGILDEDLQPSTLVGWQKGVVAFELGERLDIKNKWEVISAFWRCNKETIRQCRSSKFNQEKCIEFTKKIKALIY